MTRAEEMRELFVRWKGSGLSLMAFGKSEGVSYAKLLYWRRKFVDDTGATERSPEKRPAADTFVPLHVAPELTGNVARAEAYEVWLSNGVSVEVPTGFDEDELRRLVGVLTTC